MPKVSVIITTYNRAHFVYEAIKSVLNQTFKDLEIIVVDDGSTDNTRQVLEKHNSCISYIYKQNKGRAEARNTGIKVAEGEYIAFLDDDDVWLPRKLEKQVNFLDSHPDIGLVHAFTEVVDKDGNPLKKETKKRLKSYKKAMRIGYTFEKMSGLCIMFISSVVLRKECLDKVGLFDSHTEALEDWDFYLRFALWYRIDTFPEPLVRFRIHKAHSTLAEFTRGCINTSLKHIAMLDDCHDISFHNKILHNFYMHLANAYYIDMQLAMFRIYALKALQLNPLILFRSRLIIHFLMTMLPLNLIKRIRRLSNRSLGS